MEKQLIEYHTQIDYWENLTNEYKTSLFKDNKNKVFFCAHCNAQLIVANMGKEGTRPYFRAKNKHLQLSMNYPCKPGQKNKTIKPNVKSKKYQASMTRALHSLLVVDESDQNENPDEPLKVKKQNINKNSEETISARTEPIRKLPEEYEKIKINSTYKFKKKLKIRYFLSDSGKEYIYINNINSIGPSISIRIDLESTYFNKLKAFHDKWINIAIVIYITEILTYLENKNEFYIPILEESQMKYQIIE